MSVFSDLICFHICACWGSWAVVFLYVLFFIQLYLNIFLHIQTNANVTLLPICIFVRICWESWAVLFFFVQIYLNISIHTQNIKLSPICVFVHVEYGKLDVGDEQPLLCSLLLDVLHNDFYCLNFFTSLFSACFSSMFCSKIFSASFLLALSIKDNILDVLQKDFRFIYFLNFLSASSLLASLQCSAQRICFTYFLLPVHLDKGYTSPCPKIHPIHPLIGYKL